MAWIKRNDRRYFYLSVRDPGGRTVHSLYLGCGPEAEKAAAGVGQRKQQRAEERTQHQTDQQRHAKALKPFLELTQRTDALFRACLEANGFHQQARGPWRKRKAQKSLDTLMYPDTHSSISQSLDLETSP